MSDPRPTQQLSELQAEAARLMALSDERSRELTSLREKARRLREECGELEGEAEGILRRLLVAADATGATELRSTIRRELAAIDREV